VISKIRNMPEQEDSVGSLIGSSHWISVINVGIILKRDVKKLIFYGGLKVNYETLPPINERAFIRLFFCVDAVSVDI